MCFITKAPGKNTVRPCYPDAQITKHKIVCFTVSSSFVIRTSPCCLNNKTGLVIPTFCPDNGLVALSFVILTTYTDVLIRKRI